MDGFEHWILITNERVELLEEIKESGQRVKGGIGG
jgi:hypothetical protein